MEAYYLLNVHLNDSLQRKTTICMQLNATVPSCLKPKLAHNLVLGSCMQVLVLYVGTVLDFKVHELAKFTADYLISTAAVTQGK